MDPVQIIMQQAVESSSPFSDSSRYRLVGTATAQLQDGTEVTYVRRRFLPQPEELATLAIHTLELGDRLDNLAHQYFQEPLRFWQICDANRVLRPAELTEHDFSSGEIKTIRIGLPPGTPAHQQAY